MTYTIVIETVDAQPTPFDYTLAMAQTFTPESAFATYDGTGAGSDFLACMSFLAPDGKRFMRVFPTTPVSAGDVADVTFAPFPGGIGQSTQPTQGLPLWQQVGSELDLSNGTLDLSEPNHYLAMIQDDTTDFTSVFVRLIMTLDDPGDNTANYQVRGLPSIPWNTPDPSHIMASGVSYLITLGMTDFPLTESFIGADGTITFPGNVQPAFQSGDVLFDGFGVYPYLPE